MDYTTIFGVVGAVALVTIAVETGQLNAVFLNFHGIFLVFGGTSVAMLLNTPKEYIWAAFRAVPTLLSDQNQLKPRTVLPILISTSQNVHSQGINALRNVDPQAGGGFLSRAAQIALENNDPEYVRSLLESEVSQDYDHKTEIVNVFRTMGVLSPMFGLIGTLIGIIDVLKHISSPEQVGPNMAVAVTTAFYGILLANMVAVPLAGKLRMRYQQEYVMKGMVVEGIIEMLKGTVPAIVERKLRSFLSEA
jgi:chemotaxis protein MotA